MATILPLLAFISIYLYVVKTRQFLSDSRREAFVLAATLWGGLIVLSTEILTIFQSVTFNTISLFWLFVLIAAAGALISSPKRESFSKLPKLSDLTFLEAASLAVTFFIILIVGFVAFMAPPNSWDALVYHMSRVFFWGQNKGVMHYPTPDLRQITFQPFSEYIILHFQILAGSDRLASCVAWFSMGGAILGTSLIARNFEAKRSGQIYTALVAATIPVSIIFATSVKNESVSAFWLVCFVHFILKSYRAPSVPQIVFAGLCLGFGILTKGTMYIYMCPFVVWFFCLLVRKRGWPRAIKGVFLLMGVAIFVNLGFFIRNIQLVGMPIHGGGQDNIVPFAQMDLSAWVCLVARHFAFQLGNSLHFWNNLVVSSVEGLHNALNVGIKDTRIIWSQLPVFVSVSTQEDGVTNFLQVLLVMISSPFILLSKEFKGIKGLKAFWWMTLIATLLYCCLIKWSYWSSKLLLPMFVLCAPLIGVVLERKFSRNKVVLILCCLILASTSMPYVFRNNLRRIVSGGKSTVLNTSREELYFRNDSARIKPYQKAVDYVHTQGCTQIGLYIKANEWDYPFLALFNRYGPNKVRLEHMDLNKKAPQDYPLGDFSPCAIISLDNDGAQFVEKHYPSFEEGLRLDVDSAMVRSVVVYN